MLLCDAAQVADGKLYVLGGGWSMTGPDPVPSAHRPQDRRRLARGRAGPPLGAVPRGRRRPAGAWWTRPTGTHPVEVRGRVHRRPPARRARGLARSTWPWPSTSDRCPLTAGHPLHLAPHHRRRVRRPDWALGFTTRPPADGWLGWSQRSMTIYDRPFGRYFEDFEPGDVYRHWPGKTITESDDHLFCMITMNHHPLHTNAWFAEHETVHGQERRRRQPRLLAGARDERARRERVAPSPTSRSSRSSTGTRPSTATPSTPRPGSSTRWRRRPRTTAASSPSRPRASTSAARRSASSAAR